MRRGSILRSGEYALLLLGAILIAIAGTGRLRYQVFQTHTYQAGAEEKGGPLQASKLPLLERLSAIPAAASKFGSGVRITSRLVIPRLGLSVLVVDGDEEQGLSVAAVHLAGTSAVGQTGNAVIAGHRDTAFWPLRNIETGDLIQVNGKKHYRYRVESIRIVGPDDTTALASGSGSVLTLVTCYPFRHVGSAPQRFVVRAELVS